MVNIRAGGIPRIYLVLAIVTVIAVVAVAGNLYLFTKLSSFETKGDASQNPSQTPTLERIKIAPAATTTPNYLLIIEAGIDRGIWAKYNLDPEFVYPPEGRPVVASDLGEMVAQRVDGGFITPNEVLLAHSAGVPVKIVAGFSGECILCKLYVAGGSSLSTVRDLDGKKVGVLSSSEWRTRFIAYLNIKFSINMEAVPVGNLTNQVVALKLGRIDAFISSDVTPMRLVDSGELKVLISFHDVVTKTWASYAIFISEDLIQRNPDLARRFVAATLETTKYLKENPSYTVDMYIKKTNAPKDLAEKVVSYIDWTPSGRGSGSDLIASVTNNWQYNKDTGAIPISTWEKVKVEDAIDTRFLP